jgi:hypothetical protein
MTKPNYEFPYISRRQKIDLILCKLFLILLILAFQALMVHGSDLSLSESLNFTSGIMLAICCYINLMTVRVEVRELFEKPLQWKGQEFFWIGVGMSVASYFV